MMLASILSAQGDRDEAYRLAKRTTVHAERTLEPNSKGMSECWFEFAEILAHRGEKKAASEAMRKSFLGRERRVGPRSRDVLMTLNRLASLTAASGDLDEARRLRIEWIRRATVVWGLFGAELDGNFRAVFGLLKDQGDPAAVRDLAQGWLREALAQPVPREPGESRWRRARIEMLALQLGTLAEPLPIDSELAARAAEAVPGTVAAALLHFRLGRPDDAWKAAGGHPDGCGEVGRPSKPRTPDPGHTRSPPREPRPGSRPPGAGHLHPRPEAGRPALLPGPLRRARFPAQPAASAGRYPEPRPLQASRPRS